MKQTAVQWLVEQIECFGNKHELQMSWATLDELFRLLADKYATQNKAGIPPSLIVTSDFDYSN
jgi:hypothetical protein